MGFFKSAEDRRIEREMKIRQGIRRIERSIKEQAQFADEFVKNARHAKEIGDERQYKFIAGSLKKTLTIRKVLERQLLTVRNALLIKRQAEATVDFTKAMGLMASEIGAMFGNVNMEKTQVDWEKAMMQSQTMEERMNVFLENLEQVANEDVQATEASSLVSDQDVERLITASEEADKAGEDDALLTLKDELNALKQQGGTRE